MISKQDFIYKVKTEVFPKLVLTERDRKKTLYKGCCWILIASVIAFFSRNLFLNGEKEGLDETLRKITITLIVGCLGYAGYIWDIFISRQKKKFSPIFLRFLGDLKNRQKTIGRELLRHTCLFSEFDNLNYDDRISGSFKDTLFSVSEVTLKRKGPKNDTTVFKGICIDIPMKIPVSGYTLLFNTKIPQKVPILEKISLEDITFRKNYQAYSDNQIDARVLLTPIFMDRLNGLKKCFQNKRVDVSFFGNHAIFAIHTSRNLFESYSLFRPVTNIKTYEKFYDEIKAIYDMVNVLHINNKSLPTGLAFNKELYQQISSIKRKRNETSLILFFLLFFVLVFLIFAIFWFVQ